MSSHGLHSSLLRPAVIHILRASGFHATKSSVVDTLTDVCARYLLLIASRTAACAYDRTVTELRDVGEQPQASDLPRASQMIPTVADVRNGLTSAAFFTTGAAASEEAWMEVMRKPLSQYPAGAREKERRRRDLEDTQDVREFVDWITGPIAKEMRRIAGVLPDEAPGATATLAHLMPRTLAADGPQHRDDYLETLKKKQGKSNDSSRYQGTTLGKSHDDTRNIKIEGGPTSLKEWRAGLKRKGNFENG